MNQRKGTYIIQKVPEESYRAFVPQPLPADPPPLNLIELYPSVEKAAFCFS